MYRSTWESQPISKTPSPRSTREREQTRLLALRDEFGYDWDYLESLSDKAASELLVGLRAARMNPESQK